MADLTHLIDVMRSGDENAARAALNALSQLDFEFIRKPLAAELNIRESMIDALRKPKEVPGADRTQQGAALALESPEPAADPQNGDVLLADIEAQIRRFLIADTASIVGMTLWSTWAHIVDKAANLAFVSPLRACGKSTALDIVQRLAPRALSVSSISPAALFRTIEALKPTLLIDEADTLFRNDDQLRTLLNAGFTRGSAAVVRIVGEDLEPRLFSTWGAKALALIGRLPDTLASRSVIIPMRRKRPDEKTERLRADRDQGFTELRSRIARWTADNGEMIVAADPDIPSGLSDRQADCWRELLRIADTAGGDWPARARLAAVAICGRDDGDEGDLGARLLVDLKTLFDTEPSRSTWTSAAIVEYLNHLEPSPWPDYARGRGIDANRLARMLAKFDVHSKNVADGKQRLKGYAVQSFIDAFARYLPASRAAATETDNSLQDNEMQSSDKVAVTDASRYHVEGMNGSSGTEPLPLPNTLPSKILQYKELNKIVAAERLGEDPLARLDSLFGGGL
jgi:putative DNA primase/helicase